MNSKNTPTVTVKRLTHLSNMINKYAHCWSENKTSDRMLGWVDEYNEARNTKVWAEYCKVSGFTLCHDAYDCLA